MQQKYIRRHSGVFMVNFEKALHCPGGSVVDLEQVNTDWVYDPETLRSNSNETNVQRKSIIIQ